jgi:hypothetical protein
MEKTLTKAAQVLQKISKVATMRRDWETWLSAEPEHDSNIKMHAEISRTAVTEDKKEESILENLKEVHTEKELPEALTSLSQMKQTKGVCQVQNH